MLTMRELSCMVGKRSLDCGLAGCRGLCISGGGEGGRGGRGGRGKAVCTDICQVLFRSENPAKLTACPGQLLISYADLVQ